MQKNGIYTHVICKLLLLRVNYTRENEDEDEKMYFIIVQFIALDYLHKKHSKLKLQNGEFQPLFHQVIFGIFQNRVQKVRRVRL